MPWQTLTNLASKKSAHPERTRSVQSKDELFSTYINSVKKMRVAPAGILFLHTSGDSCKLYEFILVHKVRRNRRKGHSVSALKTLYGVWVEL